MRGLRNRNCSNCGPCRGLSKSYSGYKRKYNRPNKRVGCNSICDSATSCGSDITCILNSYRLNKGTKEKYIYHYNLRDDNDNDYYYDSDYDNDYDYDSDYDNNYDYHRHRPGRGHGHGHGHGDRHGHDDGHGHGHGHH